MKIDYKWMKRIRWGILLLAVVVPLIFLPSVFMDMKIRKLAAEHQIETAVTFTYNGNRELKCYTDNQTQPDCWLFFPSYADLEAVEISVFAGNLEIRETGVRINAEHSEVCSLEQDQAYHLDFYDSFGQKIGERIIHVMKSAKLPTLHVTTNSGSMEYLDQDKTNKEDGTFELVDTEGDVIYSENGSRYSARGNQTFFYDKKSYQARLSQAVDLLEMGASDTWILLPNVYDPSYIRNKLIYDMALQAEMPGSPRSEYIDVYFNNIYWGMYLLCEKVEIGENRLEIKDLEAENDRLNGGSLDYVDFFDYGGRKGTELPRDPTDITGGYLIEHDYGPKFAEVKSGFITKLGECFSLKNPGHASENQVIYIQQRMQEIEDAILAADGVNPDTGKHFLEYIDLESWADKFVVEEISRNNGGGTTSSYFYKPQDSISTKVFGGPVWDYDKGFGRVKGDDACPDQLAFLTQHQEYTNWFYYLYQHSEFVDAVKASYQTKFAPYLDQMIQQEVSAHLEMIRESAAMDGIRHRGIYGQYETTEEDYRTEAEYVKTFLEERKEFLDRVWIEEEPVCIVRFADDEEGNGNRSIGVIQGNCIRELPNVGEGSRYVEKWKILGTDLEFTEQTPVTGNMVVIPVRE